MKMNKVYTRTGDDGTTGIVGGERISKSHARLEAYGTVDELNAHLGLLAAMMPHDAERENIVRIQCNLFNVGTHLATDQSTTPLYPSAQLPDGEIDRLEQDIDRLLSRLPEQPGFVLPGGTAAAAQAHVARTVCRRAERRIVALAETAPVGENVRQYVNRLSDYLFVLAKIINFNSGQSEIMWKNACR